MDELISKDAAIETLKDAMCMTGYQSRAIDAIRLLPTIGSEAVVRCKDCVGSSILNDMLICERISNVMDGYYHGTVEVVNPDDYCSRGIRQKAKPCGAKMDGDRDANAAGVIP